MSEYQRRLGARLRAIRQQQGLTLQEVEERSQGHWKAVVVGSYERGDRALSVAKLAELGDFYGVPITELLPTEESPRGGFEREQRPLKLDLQALRRDDLDPEFAPISRFAHTIQLQRGDYNGSVLTIRGEDVRALSVIYGLDPQQLVVRLEEQGVLIDA